MAKDNLKKHPLYRLTLLYFLTLVMDGIEPAVINHMLVKFLTWCRREDTENIGMMELHVIPNVCSEYSEQSFR